MIAVAMILAIGSGLVWWWPSSPDTGAGEARFECDRLAQAELDRLQQQIMALARTLTRDLKADGPAQAAAWYEAASSPTQVGSWLRAWIPGRTEDSLDLLLPRIAADLPWKGQTAVDRLSASWDAASALAHKAQHQAATQFQKFLQMPATDPGFPAPPPITRAITREILASMMLAQPGHLGPALALEGAQDLWTDLTLGTGQVFLALTGASALVPLEPAHLATRPQRLEEMTTLIDSLAECLGQHLVMVFQKQVRINVLQLNCYRDRLIDQRYGKAADCSK